MEDPRPLELLLVEEAAEEVHRWEPSLAWEGVQEDRLRREWLALRREEVGELWRGILWEVEVGVEARPLHHLAVVEVAAEEGHHLPVVLEGDFRVVEEVRWMEVEERLG